MDQKFTDDPVQIYLAEVDQVPPLSHDDELLCIQHLRAGGQHAELAGKRLLEANLRMVVSIAQRYGNKGIHMLNLIQKGNVGLFEALKTFGTSDQDDFTAYAAGHIERAIREAVNHDGSVG